MFSSFTFFLLERTSPPHEQLCYLLMGWVLKEARDMDWLRGRDLGTQGKYNDGADVARSRDEAQGLANRNWIASVYRRQTRRGHYVDLGPWRLGCRAWYWLVKQEIETHASFSQRGIPGGKKALYKGKFARSCTNAGSQRAGPLLLQSRPLMTTYHIGRSKK